jgi:hypothetical protein
MLITFTIKIRDKHNPKEFKEGMGNGVLLVQPIEFEKLKTTQDLNDPMLQKYLYEKAKELLDEYIEVTMDIPDENGN